MTYIDIQPFGKCWLHGSRGMRKRLCRPIELPKTTDWDYACQHFQPWQQVFEEAIKEGWKEVKGKSHWDNDTAFVFEKLIGEKKVQVSLRQNLLRYQDCFNSISPDFYFAYLWKGSDKCLPVEVRRDLYNTLYYLWDIK